MMTAMSTVPIWRIALNGPSGPSHRDCLDDEDRRRAAAFKFDRDRHRFIRAHAALRRILSRLCGVPPHNVPLQVDAHLKPILPSEYAFHFNLSHSEERALLIVSHAAPVGIDLERVRPMPDTDELAARHFSPRECAYLQTVPAGADRERAFFRCWTRKEAFVKCTGVGLRTDLRRIESGFEGDSRVEGVLIRSLPDDEDFAAAIAIAGEPATPDLRDYQDALS